MPKLMNPNCVLNDQDNDSKINLDDILIDEESMSKYDFSKSNANDVDLEHKRDMAIKYINSKNDYAELLENPFAHILINFICNSSIERKFNEQMPKTIERYVKIGYEKKLISFLDYQLDNLSKLNFLTDSKEEIKLVYSKLNLIKMQLITLLNLTDCSILFSDKLYETKAIETFFKLIKHEFLLNVLKNSVHLEQTLESVIQDLFKNVTGILFNMSKLKDKYINEWIQANATRSLLNLVNSLSKENLNKFKSVMQIHNITYILVACIATDEEIESLTDISLVINQLVNYIASFAKMLNGEGKLKRSQVQIFMDGEAQSFTLVEVTRLSDGWSCIELMDACYHLAVCDKVKYELYFSLKMCDYLRTIIYKGNRIEVMYALNLIYQLAFDKRICEHIKSDINLMEKIKHLNITDDSNVSTKKSCQGILWMIEETTNTIQTQAITKTDAKGQHIMISYNRESRELCLKIKIELEKMNYKVWIDVESIHGSSLESMALAIENAICVLMCMTEKYKQSNYCRAEAEYAFNLNKPIIPLIMQNNYQPSGWLVFSECIERLTQEILNIEPVNIKSMVNFNKTITEENLTKTNLDASYWKESEVENWFKNESINPLILDDLRPCDGLILSQLFEILKTSPDFFYSALTAKNKISLRDVAVFTYKLKNLFKK